MTKGTTMANEHDDWYVRTTKRRSRALSRDEERTLMQRLDAARLDVAEHALASPAGLEHLGDLAESVRRGTVDVRDVVRAEADTSVAVSRQTFLKRWTGVRRLAQNAQAPARRTALSRALLGLRLAPEHVDQVVAALERAYARQQDGDAKAARTVRLTPEALATSVTIIRDAKRTLGVERARLIEANLRLVMFVARRFRHRGLDVADLVQEGTIGLLRAVDLFDVGRGVTFATYASWWIRQTMGRAIEKQGRTIRLPGTIDEELRSLRRQREQLAGTLGRPPRVEDLTAATGFTREKVEQLLELEQSSGSTPLSLDEPLDLGDERPLVDTLADDHTPSPFDAVADQRLVEESQEMLETLRPRERDVLTRRFGLDRKDEETFEQIGTRYRVTRQCVCQLAGRAIRRIRESDAGNRLRGFYDS
jgi:RNA polymerase primary sigma factor